MNTMVIETPDHMVFSAESHMLAAGKDSHGIVEVWRNSVVLSSA
jgi:hypothetical protein